MPPTEPFCGLVFKIVTDPFVGKLAYFRVYSGALKTGTYVYNSSSDKRERVGRSCRCTPTNAKDRGRARRRDRRDRRAEGHGTGDTLCDQTHPISRVDLPRAGHRVAIEPKSTADQDKMGSR